MPGQAPDRSLPGPIPHFDLGGGGPPLHFLHANGYPPACYAPLLDNLRNNYHVFGMLLRPLWAGTDPRAIRDWRPFSNDLLQFLEYQQATAVVGLGHSIGAVVTLRAALRQPERFRALVLMDPVLLPSRYIVGLRVLRTVGLARRTNALAGAALRRRQHFQNRDQLYAGYRRRDVFRFISDDKLHALVEGITKRTADGGYELVYSREWEARIYQTGIWNDLDIWTRLPTLKVPTLIIRGEETDTFWQGTGRQMQRNNRAIQVVTVPHATHLVPMERPAEVFETMQEFMAQIS